MVYMLNIYRDILLKSCGANDNNANCNVGNLNCEVNINGYVNCNDNSANENCEVDASGHANCES